jgi:20S proteasome alpha/beta subunit
MKFKMNMYKFKEGREMKADTFSKLIATTLYEKR